MAEDVKKVQRLQKKLAWYDEVIDRCRFQKLKNYYCKQRIAVWEQYCDLTKQSII